MRSKAKTAEAAEALDEVWLVGAGRVATVITHLSMRAPPKAVAERNPAYALRRAVRPDLDWYRDLYRRVGEHWLWYSRLLLDDAGLARLIHDHAVEVHALEYAGRDEGILEMDFRRWPDVEISLLGVVPTLIGKGAGRFLLDRALEIAWGRRPSRVTVHTCTFDHPRALPLYLRAGFVPYARSVEVTADPRLTGILPRSAARHVPMVPNAG